MTSTRVFSAASHDNPELKSYLAYRRVQGTIRKVERDDDKGGPAQHWVHQRHHPPRRQGLHRQFSSLDGGIFCTKHIVFPVDSHTIRHRSSESMRLFLYIYRMPYLFYLGLGRKRGQQISLKLQVTIMLIDLNLIQYYPRHYLHVSMMRTKLE